MTCKTCGQKAGEQHQNISGVPAGALSPSGGSNPGQQRCSSCGQYMLSDGSHCCPPVKALSEINAEVQAMLTAAAGAETVVSNEVDAAQKYYEAGALSSSASTALDEVFQGIEGVPELVMAAYRAGKRDAELDIAPAQWRRPSWYGKRLDYATITDKQIDEWRTETRKCDDHNRAEMERRQEQRGAARKILVALYGDKSRQIKYFDKEKPVRIWHSTESDFDMSVVRHVGEVRQQVVIEAAVEKRLLETKKATQDAIIWLQGRGLKIGTDFDLDSALATANTTAFYEKVAELEEEGHKGKLYDFVGDNCNDCEGWDGFSHRCQCGNRRVSWVEGMNHRFDSPHIYAEAF